MGCEDDPRPYSHDDKQDKHHPVPQSGIDRQENRGSSKRIRRREASLGEEVRTSLKMERSTRKAGDPRSKRKSTRVSLGLSFRSAFLALIVGCSVTTPIRFAIVITVDIRVFRER